jgi:uroporphyrinogen-III synthase
MRCATPAPRSIWRRRRLERRRRQPVPLIVTRPAAQAGDWVQPLRALGVHTLALPLIDIAALADPADLHAAWQALPNCALAMFVSANAVQHFLAAMPPGGHWPAGVLAGSTGPGTSAALRAGGVPAGAIVQPAADAPAFDSEALWAQLAPLPWAGRSALVVRGEGGRDWLADQLRAQGAQVQFVTAYRRLPPRLDAAGQVLLQAALARPALHVWHFSSSEAIGHLVQLGQAQRPPADWAQAVALATHPRIVQTAVDAGFAQVHRVGPTPAELAAWMRANAPAAGRMGPAGDS